MVKGVSPIWVVLLALLLVAGPPVCCFAQEASEPAPPAEPEASRQNQVFYPAEDENIPNPAAETGLAAETGQASVPFLEPGEVEGTVFDIYLSDAFKGAILARYTEDWFEIEDPEDLLTQLPELKQKDKVRELLSGRIDKVRDLPEVGSVRYDLRTFRIILLLKPEFLPARANTLTNRLPDPESKFSMQQYFGGAGAFNVRDTDLMSGSFTHETLASVGRYASRIYGTAIKDGEYRITQGSVGGVFDDYQFGVGLLQTTGQTFSGSADFTGVRFETSPEMLLDREQSYGSKLQIFVPSRARVEFFWGSRLLSVQFLDFGVQDVDTRSFPVGSYSVDVVIHEENGNVVQQRYFFIKSSFLGVSGSPTFSLQAGAARDQLDTYSIPLYQGNIRWRPLAWMETGAALGGTDEFTVGELLANAYIYDLRLGGSYSMSSEGRRGISGNADFRLWRFGLYGNVRHTLDPEIRSGDQDSGDTLPPRDEVERIMDGLSREESSVSAGITTALDPFYFTFSYNRNLFAPNRQISPEDIGIAPEEEVRTYKESWGPTVTWRLYSSRNSALTLNSSYIRTDQERNFFTYLSYTYRFSPQFYMDTQYRVENRESGTDSALLSNVTWDRMLNERGWRAAYTNESGRFDGDNRFDNQLAYQYEGSYLRSAAFIRDTERKDSDSTTAGLNVGSSFLIDQDGNLTIGSAERSGAVLIAEIESASTDSEFEILLNDQVVARLKAGTQIAFGVSPFARYVLSIRPAVDADIVKYDSTSFDVTVFPGNIVRRKWSAEKVFIVLGKVVDSQGNPITQQRIKGTAEYSVSEEDGTFQAEVTGKEGLYIDSKRYHCRFDMAFPKEELPDFILDVGTVVCK